MAMSKATKTIDIPQLKLAQSRIWLVGTSPLISHRFSSKAWRELLLPSREKNRAEKHESLKHDPLTEYRESMYRNRSTAEPTLLHYPSGAFSKALASAATDIPGSTKAAMLRLTSVLSQSKLGMQVNVYGCPTLSMDMVRNSDMARTPDVRTRAILPEWACEIVVEYAATLITSQQIMHLTAAAGQIVGIGDWRPQRGGPFGKFRCAEPDDAEYKRIVKTQGRVVQEKAYLTPTFYSEEAAELFEWFTKEVKLREKVPVSMREDDEDDTVMPPLETGTDIPVPQLQAQVKAARRKGNGGEVLP